MRQLQVILILYRRVWLYTNATSLLMWLSAERPTLNSDHFLPFILGFFWLRGFSQLLIWYLFRSTNKTGFVFYHHFGLSEMQLAICVYIIDLLIFSLWITLVSRVMQ